MLRAIYKKKLVLLALLFFCFVTFADDEDISCKNSLALEVALAAIKDKYPESWENYQPYRLDNRQPGYRLVRGSLPEWTLGGTPEAKVVKESCKIESVYHTQ